MNGAKIENAATVAEFFPLLNCRVFVHTASQIIYFETGSSSHLKIKLKNVSALAIKIISTILLRYVALKVVYRTDVILAVTIDVV